MTTPSASPAETGDDHIVQVVGAALLRPGPGDPGPDRAGSGTSLLVARRSAPAALEGLWEFPGGKVEPGEGPREALQRELREELGIGSRLGPEVPGPHPRGWPLNERMAMRVFLGTVLEGSPRPLEDHSELRWVPLDEPGTVLGLDWIPADRPIVRALLEGLGESPGEHLDWVCQTFHHHAGPHSARQEKSCS